MGYLYLVKGQGRHEEMKAASMTDAARKFLGKQDVEKLRQNDDSRFKYKVGCIVYKFDSEELSCPVAMAEFI